MQYACLCLCRFSICVSVCTKVSQSIAFGSRLKLLDFLQLVILIVEGEVWSEKYKLLVEGEGSGIGWQTIKGKKREREKKGRQK